MTSSKTTTAPASRRRAVQAPAKAGKPAREAKPGVAAQSQVRTTANNAIQMAADFYGQGKYKQAENVCRQVIEARPNKADAHNILGVTLQALGRSDEALETLRRAIALMPDAASYHANLGDVLRQQGDRKEAATELEKAIELDPENAQAFNNLGIVQFETRKYRQAVDSYRKAIEIRPQMAEAHNNLGNALRMVGKIDEAIEAYQDALVQREVYPEAYNNLGTLLKLQDRPDEAEHAFRKAIAQNPRYIEAYDNLAQLYIAQKKELEALRILGDALKISPNHHQTLLIAAKLQLKRNNHQAAETGVRSVLQSAPDDPEALTILGQILHDTDRYDEALGMLEKAVAANPNSAESLNFYGVTLKSVGRLDEAREQIMKALKLNDGMFGAYANLNDLVDFSEGEGEELFKRMEAIFEAAKNPEADRMLPLHYAYGKALDDRGEHERALHHYITGGRMKRAQLDYKEEDTFGFFDAIREAFPREAFENRSFEGISDERPVFIIGMPRSGSTLVEQILSSHPQVFGAGEVKYLSRALGQLRDRFPSLPKYPQMMSKITAPQLEIVAKKYLEALTMGAGDSKRVTDKLLTNYFFVGIIHLMFPKAKFVNTQRDPVDTCLSGFTKLFKDDMPHSYDLTELGRYYGKYRELMEHWHAVLPEGVLRTVHYEDVVADTEKEARTLIEFLGLEWDQKCVDFHKSDRPVKTASVAQVRKPIYKTSVKRWKKYGGGLQPLVDAIEGKPAAKTKSKATENA
ncbi:MAG TPA: tetratricopeptide repeat protein [Sphingomicrobium sp.]|nr:tetratricopeptide repeat protein [Sphingomicrobium sp.]